MNLRASYRYQLADHKKSILVFYCVFFCMYLLTMILMIALSRGGKDPIEGSMSGMETATIIFLFVSGMNSFKENFGMLMQNGVSRKSLLVSRIFVMATVSLFMMLVDKIWILGSVWLSNVCKNMVGISMTNTVSFIDMLYHRSAVLSSFGMHIETMVFNFAAYFMAMNIGYLITVAFYRMNKVGKLAIGAGLPVLFFVILPTVDTLFFKGLITESVFNFLFRVLGLTVGNPMYAVASFFVASAIALTASWLIIRRTPLRK